VDVLEKLGITYEQLAAVCRKHHLTRLAFFGSVLTDQFGPQSDVDILIDYSRDHVPGLKSMYEMEQDFQGLFGRPVDIGNFRFLYPAFRDPILQSAVDAYAA
jgi:predicted nucleotidyltransferase